MYRFTIRELIFLTMIVAVGLAYCLDRRRQEQKIQKLRVSIDDLEMQLIDERLWTRQPAENHCQLSIGPSKLIIEPREWINRELAVFDAKIKDEFQRNTIDPADYEVRPTGSRLP